MPLTRSTLARLLPILLLAAAASGCDIVGGIFKAGLWVGAIIVVLIVVLIFWIVGKLRR